LSPPGDDVCFAGRLERGKGVLVLAAAFARIAERHPEARLVLAGEGPCRPDLEALGARLGPGRVQLLGQLGASEVSAVLARARVAVAPSLDPEGAGLTPIEAALAGRPSIVSDDPALREPLDRSGGGLVVAAGDVEALAAALDRILGDRALAAALGRAGRDGALRHHTTEAAVAATHAAYGRALQRAGRRAA
jgi:glycogen(starch) synthase